MILTLAFCTLIVSPPAIQGPSSCNNMSRTLSTSAGTTLTETSCPSITLTFNIPPIGSFSITTPSTCTSGIREQTKDCFTCGPPTEGSHCVEDDFRTTTTIYGFGSGSPCPGIPSSLPTTIEEANAVGRCKEPPEIHTEETKCAGIRSCDGSPLPDQQHGDVIEQNGHEVLVWLEDPQGLLGPAAPNPTAETIAAMRSLPLEDLPPVLVDAWFLCAPIAGARDLGAKVELLFAGASSSGGDIVNVRQLSGTVLADGRYSGQRVLPAMSGSVQSLVVQDLAFDGASFFWGGRGARYYHAYAATSPVRTAAMSVEAGSMGRLVDFVGDPLRILRLHGSAFTVAPDPEQPGIVVVTETYPGVQAPVRGTSEHRIDTNLSPPRLVRTRILDDQGERTEERVYGDYREIGDGLWRPFFLSDRHYAAGAQAPRFVRTLRVETMRALSASEAAGPLERPESSLGWWYVHL